MKTGRGKYVNVDGWARYTVFLFERGTYPENHISYAAKIDHLMLKVDKSWVLVGDYSRLCHVVSFELQHTKDHL